MNIRVQNPALSMIHRIARPRRTSAIAALVVALLASAMVAPTASAQATHQCPSGGPLGELTVDNSRNGVDAVVALVGADGSVASSQYIQRRSSNTMCGIADGTYLLYFSSGAGFDSSTGRFTSQVSYQRFSDSLTFQTTRAQYTTYTVTLYGVADGNASTQIVDPTQFPWLAPST